MNETENNQSFISMKEIVLYIKRVAQAIRPNQLKLKFFRCPLCGPSLLIRLNDNELSVRCLRCKSSAITLALVDTLIKKCPDFQSKVIYELSCRGPLFKYLKEKSRQLVCSEYFDDIPPGEYKGKVQCQDVQSLTYEDSFVDICTSTEVFEHVPNDIKGFREIYRVLKEDGFFIFTVPINLATTTVERARLDEHGLEHLLPPVYHGDRLRGNNHVLCYRDYGRDISNRLRSAGFSSIKIITPENSWFGYKRPVICAHKTQ